MKPFLSIAVILFSTVGWAKSSKAICQVVSEGSENYCGGQQRCYKDQFGHIDSCECEFTYDNRRWELQKDGVTVKTYELNEEKKAQADAAKLEKNGVCVQI